MNKLVSILIPVYNRENLIEETVQSALNQTYKNIELMEYKIELSSLLVSENILAYKLALKNGQIDLLNGEIK